MTAKAVDTSESTMTHTDAALLIAAAKVIKAIAPMNAKHVYEPNSPYPAKVEGRDGL